MKTFSNGDQPAFARAGIYDDAVALRERGGMVDEGAEGLTKREYFAALAMQALCGGEVLPRPADIPELAARSVAAADALLAALDVEPEGRIP